METATSSDTLRRRAENLRKKATALNKKADAYDQAAGMMKGSNESLSEETDVAKKGMTFIGEVLSLNRKDSITTLITMRNILRQLPKSYESKCQA